MDDYEGALAQINPCKDLKGVETNLPKHITLAERRKNIVKARGVLGSIKKNKENEFKEKIREKQLFYGSSDGDDESGYVSGGPLSYVQQPDKSMMRELGVISPERQSSMFDNTD